MSTKDNFPEPIKLDSWQAEIDTMAKHIIEHSNSKIEILEAGCGNMWALDLKNTDYTLTGIDIDSQGLDKRINEQKDLDIGILGDLRDVDIDENMYDVIYNSYVLEHIQGAEQVLENFIKWLKPGGILILRIPNRESARGFLTRVTPFWFHIFYTRHLQGYKDAGKPGHAPFPTFYDRIVSRTGINRFCELHDLIIKAEYSGGHGRDNRSISMILDISSCWLLNLLTFNHYFSKHAILIYVIEKQ